MFYALAKIEDKLVEQNMNKFGALAPCTIDVNEGTQLYYDGLFNFPDEGIFAVGGPNWENDLTFICSKYDQASCDYETNAGSGEPHSMITDVHWAQNTIVNRF